MRFVSAHKLTTYLMVGFAFLTLVLSGELTMFVLAAGTLAMIGSWFWEPPRVDVKRYAPVWAVLSLLVLGYTLVRAFTGSDFLIAGVDYLLFLLIAKLFNRSSCKDYMHVYALTFLMLVAGTVLNPEISYGICFFGYALSTTWALTLFHLRREMEENFLLKHSEDRAPERVQVSRILNSRRIVGRGFFVGTSLVSVCVFVIASLMFLAIPRIGFGLFVQKRRPGITMSGFSDGIQLGGHGTIKNDNTVIMRVEVDEDLGRPGGTPLYWRGVAFDEYKDGQWRRSVRAPQTTRRITSPRLGIERYHLLYGQRKVSDAELAERLGKAVRQEIYLEPIGYDVLFGASMPLSYEFESRLRLTHPRTERNDEVRYAHGTGMKYAVYSQLERPAPEVLRAATENRPPGYDQYLQVPGEITDEVRALARTITQNAATNYDKVEAVAAWLRSNLSYTLEMRSPEGQEPIHFFLFERKQGHCEYFSSAMTIMVRTLGIPARNVNGFLGGEWNEYDEYLAVRAADAHSWVEVYFDGAGWVTFDPTPSSTAGPATRDGGVAGRLRRLLDTVRFQWFKWIIEYDLYRQLSLFDRMGKSVRGGTDSFKSVMADVRAWLAEHWMWLTGGLLALATVASSVVVLRRTRIRRRGRKEPMAELYDQVLAMLARRGHGRESAVTPREHAEALDRAGVPGAPAFGKLTEIYYAAIYGGRQGDEVLAEARELASSVEQALRAAGRTQAGGADQKPAQGDAA